MTGLSRISVRGESTELRGYMPEKRVLEFAAVMRPFGVVIASQLGDFSELSDPSLAQSMERVEEIASQSEDPADFMTQVATLHYMQAMVIRGERDEKEEALAELGRRELHHFEAEQMLDKVKTLVMFGGENEPEDLIRKIVDVVVGS